MDKGIGVSEWAINSIGISFSRNGIISGGIHSYTVSQYYQCNYILFSGIFITNQHQDAKTMNIKSK